MDSLFAGSKPEDSKPDMADPIVTSRGNLDTYKREGYYKDLRQVFIYYIFTTKAGDRIRTGDVQLGKLTFYH
jgi:hypothetical protein